MSPAPVLVLLGPTCSGKSALAMELAERLSGELISCDSMQVYRGLPIGTAQPSKEERARVPHHLVACLELAQPWNVNLFVPAARRLIDEIVARHRQPMVVGGTGLYARALCYDFQLLPSDAALAAQLREICATEAGCARLLEELSAAGEVPDDLKRNPRHLARAVEVFRLTGEPPWQLKSRSEAPLLGFRQFCLLPNFDALKSRIRRRTAAMVAAGWIDECREALKNGLAKAPTAWQALGYRDIAEYLAGRGPATEAALTEVLANRTIQYARRQLTWFRHQHPGTCFLNIDAYRPDLLSRLADEVYATFLSSCR
ncbi:MAG: tRNA (adenosine(37)-N6)-dimethylallyltransferase MiaA [Victivallales bacterium]|nr:tRNA (adenosine(37)-N6)-dimethylallyltransferase MiaA [Victivallales bacterium]